MNIELFKEAETLTRKFYLEWKRKEFKPSFPHLMIHYKEIKKESFTDNYNNELYPYSRTVSYGKLINPNCLLTDSDILNILQGALISVGASGFNDWHLAKNRRSITAISYQKRIKSHAEIINKPILTNTDTISLPKSIKIKESDTSVLVYGKDTYYIKNDLRKAGFDFIKSGKYWFILKKYLKYKLEIEA